MLNHDFEYVKLTYMVKCDLCGLHVLGGERFGSEGHFMAHTPEGFPVHHCVECHKKPKPQSAVHYAS